MTIKKIGLLTSGGDCSGLNSAIRAVVYHGLSLGWDVYGIFDATQGLLARPIRYQQLTYDIFKSDLLRRGGTILGTVNKGDPFHFPTADGGFADRSADIIDGFRQLQLDALVGIGGDGSMRIINRIAEQGNIKFVGIPKTIDNDVPFTDASIGFATAVDTAVHAIDKLRDTAESHRRVMVLEVMGRDAGFIALHAGIAGGANVILLPEFSYDIQKVAAHIQRLHDMGRHHALVVVSEAARPQDSDDAMMITMADGEKRYGGIGQKVAQDIQKITGVDARVTSLGHVQRGGVPVVADRILATALGVHAVDMLKDGKTGRVAVWQHGHVTDVPLADIVSTVHCVNPDNVYLDIARKLGISFGI